MSILKRLAAALVLLSSVLGAATVQAEDLLMVRSRQAFPEAMITLQNSIGDHGFTLSRVQRVDIGLTKSGFKTDKYRVVFFGNDAEIKRLTAKHPELIPYLPLKMAIFAEEQETLVIAANPANYERFFPSPDLKPVFQKWEREMRAIMDDVRNAE